MSHIKKKLPKVTVVMVCYNSEKYITSAIESIKKQIFKNWKLIIVNDCSTDGTKKILKKCKSKKIKTINLKKNIGAYKATDLAFKKARSKYIAILDSDDYSHKKRILTQVLELEKNSEVGLVATRYVLVNDKNKILRNSEFVNEKDFVKRFPCENLCCNSSAMFRADFLKKLKFYDKSIDYSYDYYFYLKIFNISKIKLLNKLYTYYRIHNKSRTNNFKKKNIIKEYIRHLTWSKDNNLINFSNVLLFYKNLIKCFIKLILINFKIY